jgi:hypothetical protein
VRLTLLVAFFAGLAGCQPPTNDSLPSDPATSAAIGDDPKVVWPNEMSQSNSDPWLVAHHDEIEEMHPRVLVLDFDNTKTQTDALTRIGALFESFREGSRYHGVHDANAQPFLQYELVKLVDLTDQPPPPDWPYKNSTRMPRKASPGEYVLDLQKFFDGTFDADIGIADPNDPTRNLGMCELFESGQIHELWVINEQNDPQDTIAPEGKENKQMYDVNGQPIPGQFDSCGGNGCFMPEDVPTCGVTVKFLSVLLSRGPGCQTHSGGHSIEGNFRRGGALPAVSPDFQRFGNFDLDTRFGLPFQSFYSCDYAKNANDPCVSFPTQDSATYAVNGATGTLSPYDQGCGNIHLPSNARFQYDYENTAAVLSTCEHFGLRDGVNGADLQVATSNADWDSFDALAPDCGGDFSVYWRQNLPGLHNQATRADGSPMRNWWPYLFY